MLCIMLRIQFLIRGGLWILAALAMFKLIYHSQQTYVLYSLWVIISLCVFFLVIFWIRGFKNFGIRRTLFTFNNMKSCSEYDFVYNKKSKKLRKWQIEARRKEEDAREAYKLEGNHRPSVYDIVPSDRARRYVDIMATRPGVKKREALVEAGYSPLSPSSSIDNLRGVKVAKRNMELQREDLRERAGFTITDVAERLKRRATSGKVCPSTQTDNDKVLISILGYNTPQEVNINQKSLFMEFKDLSADDLREIVRRGSGE